MMLKTSQAPPPPVMMMRITVMSSIHIMTASWKKAREIPHPPVSCWHRFFFFFFFSSGESWSRSAASISPLKSSLANPRACLIWPVLTDHVFHFLSSSPFSSCLNCETRWSWRAESLQELETENSFLASFLPFFALDEEFPSLLHLENRREGICPHNAAEA